MQRSRYSQNKSAKAWWQRAGWWLFLCGILLGSWSNRQVDEALEAKGCHLLPSDVSQVKLTPASATSLKFIALGDTGTGNEDQAKVAAAMQKVCTERGCDFVTLLGDNFYKDGVTSLNDPQWQTAFEAFYPGLHKPIMAILGNHDVHTHPLPQVLYSLKSPVWQMPNYAYRFETGLASFFAINTNCHLLGWEHLRSQLQTSSSKWVFVLGHHSLYSSGTHGDADPFLRWFWQWFIQPEVDFYLSGHNHQLEHLQAPEDNTEYIVSGAGGQHYRNQDPNQLQSSSIEQRFAFKDNGFVWFDVTPEKVQIDFFDANGKVIYQITKQKSKTTP